jgi:hypothetical protein
MATLAIRVLAAGILGTSLVLGTAACSSGSVETTLLAAINTSNGHDVRLDAVVDGSWDSFLVICPYDPDVNERLGFDWDAAPDTNASDSTQMIVFTENERVVSTSRFRFDDIDLCTGERPLMPSDTVLQFTRPAKHVWHVAF